MKRRMNKKAMIFTMLTIALISLFIVSLTVYSSVKDRTPINKRMKTMNDFVFASEKDLERQLYISGYRAIYMIQDHILSNAEYIDNVSANFEELFFNGSLVGGAPIPQMEEAIFSEVLSNLQDNAETINANISFEDPSVIISQEDPWNIRVDLIGDLIIKDNAGLAEWVRPSTNITSYVPVDKFFDPIFRVENRKLGSPEVVKKEIVKSPYINTSFSDNAGGVTNLTDYFQNSYYIQNNDAPNFLMRLGGNFSADPEGNGIECFINSSDFVPTGIDAGRSRVGHIYFNGGPGTATTSNFRGIANLNIDNARDDQPGPYWSP